MTNAYYDEKVVDNYQWLEQRHDADVSRWVAGQNDRSRAFLDALPERPKLLSRFKQIFGTESGDWYDLISHAGGYWFFEKTDLKTGRESIVSRPGLTVQQERLVFSPSPNSGAVGIGIAQPSPDGKRIVIALDNGGSEMFTFQVFDVSSGHELPDAFSPDWMPGGGQVSWLPDSSGFYYAYHPGATSRSNLATHLNQRIYLHRLGTSPKIDTALPADGFSKIAEISLSTSSDHRYHMVKVANGPGGDASFFEIGPSGRLVLIANDRDQVKGARFGPNGSIYIRTVRRSPNGRILRISASNPGIVHAREVVKESSGVIKQVIATSSKLYVLLDVAGHSEIRMYSLAGKFVGKVPTMPLSTADELRSCGGDAIMFLNGSYTQTERQFLFDPSRGGLQPLSFGQKPQTHGFDDVVVRTAYATSKDGTRVPMHILYKKGLPRNGDEPTLMTGYGGYGTTFLRPGFGHPDVLEIEWIESGGVVAFTGLRGGGEYGENWHSAGMLTKKQNVFDDFIACAEYLIRDRYTNPTKLAITGASNGGLLIGAVLTQRPDLFRAAVADVGLYDMLRFELTMNGGFNVTEFGSVKNPTQFRALYKYSPYHRVVEGKHYPAVLLSTGANDTRVEPWQSWKMAARLQAATSSNLPILLWTAGGSGHSPSAAGNLQHFVDSAAFLFHEVGFVDSAHKLH